VRICFRDHRRALRRSTTEKKGRLGSRLESVVKKYNSQQRSQDEY
jgi:hypothetical protein